MKINKTTLLVSAAATLFAMPAFGALSSYSEDFEGLDMSSPTALGDAGWNIFANVFTPDGLGYLYGYGVFPAPNGGGGFSNVAGGEGGPAQGDQQLVIFNDYNNADHNIGNRIEANVFQEQIISAGDVGSEYTFSFDAKLGDIAGASTALAFIKTLDPNNGFATTNFIQIDTTSISGGWDHYSMSLFIDGGLDGQILQFGFANTAANFDASGVFYDNVDFRPVPLPGAVWLMMSGLAAFSTMRRKSA